MSQSPRRNIAQLAVAVIAADGRVTESEIAAISHLERLGLGNLAGTVQEELEQAARGAPIDVVSACRQLGPVPKETAALIVWTLARIAASDQDVSSREIEVLTSIGRALGIEDVAHIVRSVLPASGTDRLVGREGEPARAPSHLAPLEPAPRAEPAGDEEPARRGASDDVSRAAMPMASRPSAMPTARDPEIDWARQVFGVPPGAGLEDLNARYRALVQTYDPAKMIDLGPEFAVLAVQRLSDATTAYRILIEAQAGG